MALREGLNFVICNGISREEMESDSIQLIRSINGQPKLPLEIDSLVADIHHQAIYLEIKFQYVNRQSNQISCFVSCCCGAIVAVLTVMIRISVDTSGSSALLVDFSGIIREM
ncbi:hypothetical protein LIER_12242 [Lithospermum erythrorhizon]|uniref:RNase H type-1 domain-containing protein n=1 Tax=Lithospermum erythrorhizon TaxID=34254 RepID=A0AAV3PSQ9_LITER